MRWTEMGWEGLPDEGTFIIKVTEWEGVKVD